MSGDIPTVNGNMLEALAAFSWVKKNGRADRLPGLSLAISGVDYGLFNTAVFSGPAPGEGGPFEERVARAAAYFAAQRTPWSLWLCEDLLDADTRRRARIVLAARRLYPVMEAPGMVAEDLLPAPRPAPRLEFQRVGGLETRTAFARIMASAFEMPEPLAGEVYSSETLWRSPFTGWVGYEHGLPVTTAATMVAAGAVGVYAVGTHPLCRRRGLAEAVVRHAVAEARRETGVRRTVLQSSPPGFSLYLRMGYRQVTRMTVFLGPSAP